MVRKATAVIIARLLALGVVVESNSVYEDLRLLERDIILTKRINYESHCLLLVYYSNSMLFEHRDYHPRAMRQALIPDPDHPNEQCSL